MIDLTVLKSDDKPPIRIVSTDIFQVEDYLQGFKVHGIVIDDVVMKPTADSAFVFKDGKLTFEMMLTEWDNRE